MPGRDLPDPSSRSLFHHTYPRHDATQYLHALAIPNPATSSQSEHAPPQASVITHFDDQPITEDVKATSALSGATFVQPAVIDHQGRKTLVFAFAVRVICCACCCAPHDLHRDHQDLAVKIEGQFFLRYRCFDLFSRVTGQEDLPIQSECYGGAFKIYSTKEFPGLQASTELTKVIPLPNYSLSCLTRLAKLATGEVGGEVEYPRDRAKT